MTVFRFSDLAFMGAAAGYAMTDAAAAAYVARVEGATGDNQALEPGVRRAIDEFVIGCKADGIWNAIKTSCILAGARTLNGALQPLVGAAPTNFNFVSDDYNRKTGLVGNGTNKYVDSNRNALSSDAQNNYHCSAFISEFAVAEPVGLFGPFIAARLPDTGTGSVAINNVNDGVTPRYDFFANMETPTPAQRTPRTNLRLVAISRSSSSSFSTLLNGSIQTDSATSFGLPNANWTVFARSPTGTGQKFGASRLAFYSIGESLNLALLDARVTTLINAYASALP